MPDTLHRPPFASHQTLRRFSACSRAPSTSGYEAHLPRFCDSGTRSAWNLKYLIFRRYRSNNRYGMSPSSSAGTALCGIHGQSRCRSPLKPPRHPRCRTHRARRGCACCLRRPEQDSPSCPLGEPGSGCPLTYGNPEPALRLRTVP